MKTPIINHKNIQSFCRTCLSRIEKSGGSSKGQKYKVSHNKDLPKLISLITSVEVNNKDGYPKFLCNVCFQKFENFKEFRLQCLQSKQTLDNILDAIKSESEKCIDDLTKKEVCDIETALQKYDEIEHEREEANDWLKYEEDDKNLIPLMVANVNNELNEFKEEKITESVSGPDKIEGCEETFEYKDCADDEAINDSKNTENSTGDRTDDDNPFLPGNESESSADELVHTKRKIPSRRSVKKTLKQKDKQSNSEKRVMIQCPQCSRRCLSQENLDAHMRTHQGLKEFACKMCDRAYDKACRLKVHIDTKHRPQMEEFTCSFEGCGKKFTRTDSYRAHFRLKHTENQAPRYTYVCEDCGRVFQNVTQLREHRYKHFPKELYPYHCEQCGKRYTSQRTFKEHQLRHAGIKKFECKFCGMKKTTIKELNVHLNYHTKEKQWPCQLCTSVFNSSANLGLHVRIVHKGIRRFACGYCDQSFGKADTLKHHEMRHTGEKPHECQICGKRFIQAVALRTHLKTHKKLDEKLEKLTVKQQKLQQEVFQQQPQSSIDIIESTSVCLI